MKCLIQEYDQIVRLRPKETLTRSDIWREVETIIKRLLGRMRRLSPRASVRFANDAAAASNGTQRSNRGGASFKTEFGRHVFN